MKSSIDNLKQRGKMDIDILNACQSLSYEELLASFHKDAQTRTACIHVFAFQYHDHPHFTSILLQQLQKETALYTKIEIQNSLSQYGDVIEMCSYLGKIGHNQYQKIPTRGSLKKSYPLPRDIIARSLAYMNPEHFQTFVNILPTLKYKQLLEAIDALGFFCFYHPNMVTDTLYQFIADCVQFYQQDEFMTWKLITCLSAFGQSRHLLQSLQGIQKHPTLQFEIERSLKIISSQDSH